MAHKRMFSKDITGSDAFLEMPASSQALYFHLGMEADDDGFIGNPKKVMRVMGVSDDDFKILLAKRFLLSFPSGIVVVKHHRINNNWDSHNCKRTIYLEEFSSLRIKENKAYTLDETQGTPVQTETRLKPVFRIEENRIDKNTSAVAIAPRVVEVTEEDENARPSKEKDPNLDRSVKYWRELCKRETDLTPSTGIPTIKKILKNAHAHLTWPQIKQKMDEWFDVDGLQDHEKIQITRCFSTVQIDAFKAENV